MRSAWEWESAEARRVVSGRSRRERRPGDWKREGREALLEKQKPLRRPRCSRRRALSDACPVCPPLAWARSTGPTPSKGGNWQQLIPSVGDQTQQGIKDWLWFMCSWDTWTSCMVVLAKVDINSDENITLYFNIQEKVS